MADRKVAMLGDLERKVLWLATWMIHNANHLRDNEDGLKVGGHQASSASLATIMTALYFSVLRPEDRVAVKPHASPIFHAIQYLLGNQTLECLPLLEYAQGPGGKIVPAPLREDIAERVRACANDAFRAAGCRDFARVDLRIPTYGEPVVIDVQWYDLFAGKGSFVLAAEARGLTFAQLMRRIVEEAARRYVESSPGPTDVVRPSTVVSLDERRAAMG